MAIGIPRINKAFTWRFRLVELDGVTPVTGASPEVTISKSGASFASLTGNPSVTEVGLGWYSVLVPASDMNFTDVILRATVVEDHLPVDQWFYLDTEAISEVKIDEDVRDAIANHLLNLEDGVEDGITLKDAMRFMASILVGQLEGAGTTSEIFKAINDGDTPRVTSTTDSNGNRTSITLHFDD